jgi:hypothetical protein
MAIRYLTGVNIDSNTLFVDSTNNRVGIGTASPTYTFDIVNTSSPTFRITRNGATDFRISASTLSNGAFLGTYSNSPLQFLTNSNVQAVITTAGNVGIGTTSPVGLLNLNNGDAWINVTDTLRGLQFGFAGPSHGSYRAAVMGGAESYGGTDSGMLTFHTQNGYVVSAIPPERMRITSSGNVGIGTTSPSGLLHVSGVANYNTGIIASGNTVNGVGLALNNANGHDWYLISTGTGNGGGANNLGFYNATVGEYRVYFKGDGNVGIGTTSPLSKLSVSPSNNDGVGLYDSSNNLRGLLFINNTGGVFSTGIRTGNYWLDLDASGTSQNAIRMFTGTGGIGTGTERMRIDASGNVGIGTTSPAGTLDIGKNNATPSLVIGNSAYGANFNSVWGLQSGAQSIMIFGNNGQNEIRAGNTGVGGYLDFYTNNTASFTTASNGNFVMRLSSGGNVGIGTTSPSFKLDVAGAASDWATRFYSNAGASAYFAHGGGYGGYINAGSNASSSTYLLELISNGSTRVYVRGDGNVGIGTTSPARKLDVVGTGRFSSDLTVSGSSRLFLNGITGQDWALRTNSSSGNLDFVDWTTEVSRVSITAGGNVGIGTTSPSSKLSVEGTTSIYSSVSGNFTSLSLQNTSTSVSARNILQFSNNVGAVGLIDVFGGNWSPTGGGDDVANGFRILAPSDGGLSLRASTSTIRFYTGSSERMRITSAGNVGIGTTSPTVTLEVSGRGLITSSGSSDTFAVTHSSGSGIGVNITKGGNGEGLYVNKTSGSGNAVTIVGTLNATTLVKSGGTSSQYLMADGSVSTLTNPVTGTGTTNYVPKWTSGSAIGNSQIFDDGTNVGIGVTSPNGKLEIRGLRSATKNLLLNLSKFDYGATAFYQNYSNTFYTNGKSLEVEVEALPLFQLATNNAGTDGKVIFPNGNVGIGTTSELARTTILSDSSAQTIGLIGRSADNIATIRWWNNAGNTIYTAIESNANYTIYNTVTNGYAAFFTNNSERLRITSAGNVGIGTTSPGATYSEKLQVLGSSLGRINVTHTTTSDPRQSDILFTENDTITFQVGTVLSNGTYGDQNWLRGVGSLPVTIHTDSLERLRVTSSGNVGIGTTSPGQKLTVDGTAAAYSAIGASDNVRTGLAQYDTSLQAAGVGGQLVLGYKYTNAEDFTEGAIIKMYKENGTSGAFGSGLKFQVRNDGANLSTKLILDPSGNLGVGTTSPSNPLHVSKDAGGSAIAFFESLNSDGYGVAIRTADTGNDKYVLRLDSNSGTTPVMYASNAGNVGIGTTSPQTELHVKGNNGWGEVRVEGQTFASGHGASLEFYSEGTALADIYASTDKHLYFRTNGTTERMRILANGNVGINTTAPSARLQVVKGSSGNVASFTTENTLINSYAGITLNATTQGADDWYGSEIRNINVQGSPNFLNPRLAFFVQNTNTYLPADRGEKMTILGDGNVGIGTTSPVSSANSIFVTTAGVNAAGYVTRVDGTTSMYVYSITTESRISEQRNLPLVFETNGTEKMRITALGRVIIGRTFDSGAPFNLQVDGRILQTGTEFLFEGDNDKRITVYAARPLIFATTDTERMRIQSNGDVYIRNITAAPANGQSLPGSFYFEGYGWNTSAGSENIQGRINLAGEYSSSSGSTEPALVFSLKGSGGGNVTQAGPSSLTERMRITNYGNVGIGTTSPGAKLDVNGEVYVSPNTAGKNTFVLTTNASNDGRLLIKSDTTTKVDIQANGTTYFNGGNVGIGTTSPLSKQQNQIEANGSALFLVNAVGGGGAYVDLDFNTYNPYQVGYANPGATIRVIDDGAYSGHITFRTKGASIGAAQSERMRITGTGNVGIGTTAPLNRFAVIASNTFGYYNSSAPIAVFQGVNPTLLVANDNNTDDAASEIRLGNAQTSYYTYSPYIRALQGGGIDNYRLEFGTSNFAAATTRMTITAAGNVGIGTTSPSFSLSVNRATTATAQFNVNNNMVASFRSSTVAANAWAGIKLMGDEGSGIWFSDEGGTYNHGYISQRYTGQLDFATGTDSTAAATVKMTILSGGNVGIGTTSPASKLHVVGPINIERIGVANVYSTVDMEGNFRFNASDGYAHTFLNNGSELVRIMPSGNVGIGTTAPGQLLTIQNTSGNPYLSIIGGAAATMGVLLGTTGNTVDGQILYSNSTQHLGFVTASAERMRITSTGNVGIGTTSPVNKLQVTSATNDVEVLRIDNTAGNSGSVQGVTHFGLNFFGVGNNSGARITAYQNGVSGYAGGMYFSTRSANSDSAPVEAMRITHDQLIGLGPVSSFTTTHRVWIDKGSSTYAVYSQGSIQVNAGAIGVGVTPSATTGRIDAGNDIVAYSTSDSRLKENITPIANALDKVKSLTGVEFDWKEETKGVHGYEGHDVGVIAQEVQAVLPEAIRTNDSGYLSVRYEKMIALLIEGMKEQQNQIDELKAKLDGLTK